MDHKLKKQDNQQSNIVSKSKDEMTLIEKRIVYLIINQLNNSSNFKNDGFKNLNFTLSFTTLKESNYERIRNSVSKLQSRTLTLIDNDDKEEFKRVVPFPLAKVTGTTIEITMAEKVLPHFLELKNNFTQHELAAALSLNSIYSQNMYELLNRRKDEQEWIVSLSELQKLLHAENYRYIDFKKNCLEKAILELNQKTNLQVTFTTKKESRSVSAIQFEINSKVKQKKADVKQVIQLIHTLTPAQIIRHINRLLSAYSFTEQQKEQIMNSSALFHKFIELESQITSGEVKDVLNPTAYISGFLFLPE